MADNSTGLQENVAGLLCYLFSWVGGLVFFLIDKRPTVRFHAMQSIILGAATFTIIIVLSVTIVGLLITWVVWLAYLVLSILLMVRTYQGTTWKLPLIGNLAEKWAQ